MEFKGVRIRRMHIILLSRYLILKVKENDQNVTWLSSYLYLYNAYIFIYVALKSCDDESQIVIEIRKPTYFSCDLHVHSSRFLLVTQQQPVSTYPVHYSRQKEQLAKPYIYFNFIYPLSTSETNTIRLQLCSARRCQRHATQRLSLVSNRFSLPSKNLPSRKKFTLLAEGSQSDGQRNFETTSVATLDACFLRDARKQRYEGTRTSETKAILPAVRNQFSSVGNFSRDVSHIYTPRRRSSPQGGKVPPGSSAFVGRFSGWMFRPRNGFLGFVASFEKEDSLPGNEILFSLTARRIVSARVVP